MFDWLSFVSTAYAQQATASKGPSTLELLVMPIGFLVIMYFLIIRPQSKKAKEQAAMVKSLKVGDEVITTGGIIGRVKAIADTFVTVDINNGSMKVLKNHVSVQAPPKPNQALKEAKESN